MKRTLSLLMIISMVFISGCGFVSGEKEIAGTYKIQDSSMGDIDEMVFTEDGNMQIVTKYVYTIEKKEDKQILTLKKSEDEEVSTQYVVEKSEEKYKMYSYYNGEQMTENAIDVSPSEGTDGILGSGDFTGTYRDESNKIDYEFSKDGSMKIAVNETFTVSGKKLTFTGTAGSTAYTLEKKEDGKKIEVSDETSVIFTLVKE